MAMPTVGVHGQVQVGEAEPGEFGDPGTTAAIPRGPARDQAP